jgi:hypothetical protein
VSGSDELKKILKGGPNMRNLIFSIRTVPVFCTLILLSILGCGYFSYVAYYAPGEVIEQGREAITSKCSHLLPGKIGGYQIWLTFWPVWEGRGARELFDVQVEFEPTDTIVNEIDSVQMPSVAERQVPFVSLIELSSPATPEIDTLTIVESFDARGRRFYKFGRVRLPRKYGEIVVRFTAVQREESGETIESCQYEVKLKRWEDRNWLGLE